MHDSSYYSYCIVAYKYIIPMPICGIILLGLMKYKNISRYNLYVLHIIYKQIDRYTKFVLHTFKEQCY